MSLQRFEIARMNEYSLPGTASTPFGSSTPAVFWPEANAVFGTMRLGRAWTTANFLRMRMPP